MARWYNRHVCEYKNTLQDNLSAVQYYRFFVLWNDRAAQIFQIDLASRPLLIPNIMGTSPVAMSHGKPESLRWSNRPDRMDNKPCVYHNQSENDDSGGNAPQVLIRAAANCADKEWQGSRGPCPWCTAVEKVELALRRRRQSVQVFRLHVRMHSPALWWKPTSFIGAT